jgi:hypothetical protein
VDNESVYVVDANGNQIRIGDKVILSRRYGNNKKPCLRGAVCNGFRFEKGKEPYILLNGNWCSSDQVTAATALGSVEHALFDSFPSGTDVEEIKKLAALVKALAIEERTVEEPMIGEVTADVAPAEQEQETTEGDA